MEGYKLHEHPLWYLQQIILQLMENDYRNSINYNTGNIFFLNKEMALSVLDISLYNKMYNRTLLERRTLHF